MTINWNGIHPNKLIFGSGLIGILFSLGLVRWMYENYIPVQDLVISLGGFELFILMISLISVLTAIIWWLVDIRLVPMIIPLIGRTIFRSKTLYIDKNQIRYKSSLGQFISRYITLVLASFSLNFLLSSNYFETSGESVSVFPFAISLVLLTFLVPIEWILQDCGIRALDPKKLEITSVADLFGDMTKDYVVTSSVFVSFLSLLIRSNLSNLSLYMQVSLVRSIFPCFIIAYVFTVILTSKPSLDQWKYLGIPPGETIIKFDR